MLPVGSGSCCALTTLWVTKSSFLYQSAGTGCGCDLTIELRHYPVNALLLTAIGDMLMTSVNDGCCQPHNSSHIFCRSAPVVAAYCTIFELKKQGMGSLQR